MIIYKCPLCKGRNLQIKGTYDITNKSSIWPEVYCTDCKQIVGDVPVALNISKSNFRTNDERRILGKIK